MHVCHVACCLKCFSVCFIEVCAFLYAHVCIWCVCVYVCVCVCVVCVYVYGGGWCLKQCVCTYHVTVTGKEMDVKQPLFVFKNVQWTCSCIMDAC